MKTTRKIPYRQQHQLTASQPPSYEGQRVNPSGQVVLSLRYQQVLPLVQLHTISAAGSRTVEIYCFISI